MSVVSSTCDPGPNERGCCSVLFGPVTFTRLPAVDVSDGRAVCVVRGEAGTETTYGAPRDVALAWQAEGAEWIHLVDLDGAFGRGSNAELLAAVIGELDVKVEVSGGVRDDASLEWALSTGASRVILSTAALEDPAWCARALAVHGERIAVALDVRVVEYPDGSVRHRLVARGGTRDSGDLWETLARLDRNGRARYVVTDVSTDGALRGPNVALYRLVTEVEEASAPPTGSCRRVTDRTGARGTAHPAGTRAVDSSPRTSELVRASGRWLA